VTIDDADRRHTALRGRDQLVQIGWRTVAAASEPVSKEQVGAGDVDDVGVDLILADGIAGTQGLGQHHPGGKDVHARLGGIIRFAPTIPHPVPTGEHLAASLWRRFKVYLLDPPCGKPHIETLAVLPVEELLEAPTEHALELPAIGRFEVDQIRQSHPYQRGHDGLMRAPLAAQGDA